MKRPGSGAAINAAVGAGLHSDYSFCFERYDTSG